MCSEDTVAIADCILLVEGRASPKAEQAVCAGLPRRPGPKERVCFVSFAYADLPLPKVFDTVFLRSDPRRACQTTCCIEAVTQQFAKPFDEVPHGWKTVCLLVFPDGVPALVDELPEVGGWYEGRDPICLSSKATWEAWLNSAVPLLIEQA